MNRRIAQFALSLTALLLLLAAPASLLAQEQAQEQAKDYSYARIVRLSYVEGDVQVQRPDATSWEDALVNLPIRQGYQISTRQGRAEVEFESGAVARLADDTLVQFTELALSGGGRLTQLSLLRGTATFYANLSSEDRFTVTTPQLTVSVPRNARFRIDSEADGTTVAVQKGDITVDALGASYHVNKGRAFLFRVDGEQVTLARAPDADAWDRWVEDRENILSASRQAISNRYARTSYSYGMYDLDYYGGWYSLPGYGYGWQPRGISLGWSPYCSGRWMDFGGALTWVSYEPWGWMPYHYGHWVYLPGGWYWVPGGFNQWQPALVYWVNLGGNRWGWGPLNPHDRPGQPPANLPHGTVVTGIGHPRDPDDRVHRRFDQPTPGEMASAHVVSEPPEPIARGARFRDRGVTGADRVDPPIAPPPVSTPATGFTGTPKVAQPGDVPRDEGRTPRMGGRPGEAGTPSGIVYDPQQKRYVNSNVPGRADAKIRTDSPDAPAAPAARGFSGTTTTPPDSRPAPPVVTPRTDRPEVQRDGNRLPGRREETDIIPAQIRPAQPPQRPPSATLPPAQPQPRMDTPRPASPPPAQQPRWGSQPRPASPPPPPPQPRVEPVRPASPPPAPPPAPRSEPRERPQTKPPHS